LINLTTIPTEPKSYPIEREIGTWNDSSVAFGQIPLIHIVDEDDQLLLKSDADWYKVLHYFPYNDWREVAAEYYDTLYHFNQSEAQKRKEREETRDESWPETKEEATQRLLFDRATMSKAAPVIFEEDYATVPDSGIDPGSIAPGMVPDRLGGKKPKCFFALVKAFIGTATMGFPAEPEHVHLLLSTNPPFARVCGFVPKGEEKQYWYKHVPSLRKLEQFDMIMTRSGLWEKMKWQEVLKNIEAGIIGKENELVGDTTHYHAYSSFKTVRYVDEKGKEHVKSQCKVTKHCHCEDKESCRHPWELADEGAGTIVKSNHKMIWGHKASVLGLPRQGIPLDAVAIADGATHDGETLFPHVDRLFESLPMLIEWIDTVLYDSACDDRTLKEKFEGKFQIDLKTSLNPRRRQAVTDHLPKGMEKMTPYGNLICKAGYEMDYQGIRYEAEKFIYQAPVDENDVSVCMSCDHKMACCPRAKTGRMVNISFDVLPHIDKQDPPMAKRFKAIMMRRPSIERIIKRLKCDLSDDRLSKRSNSSFQAYLDKTMIAFHMLLRNWA
jgi:hypothetical protein